MKRNVVFHGLNHSGIFATQIQQLIGESTQPIGFLRNDAQRRSILLWTAFRTQSQFRFQFQRGQRGSKLMRCIGREPLNFPHGPIQTDNQ